MSGLAEYRNNVKIVRPYQGQNPGGEFIALTRYERADTAIEFQFGEGQYILECHVYYGPAERMKIDEIIAAARKGPRKKIIDWGLTRPEMIDENLDRIAAYLLAHRKIILEPSPKLLSRIKTIRDMQIEQAVRRHFAQTIKEATIKAAVAYRQKDFRLVISALEPYRPYLSTAELKKLQLAKKQLLT